MPFPPRPRLSSVLTSVLAAGIMLTVASCSHDTPAPTAPTAHAAGAARSGALFVLKAVRTQPATGAGGCPDRSVALSGGPGQCYRQLGTPVTITSATVGPVITDALHFRGLDGFWIVLPAADVAALLAITTTAADAQANLAISVAGRGWLLPIPGRPFTNGQVEIFLPKKGNSLTSRNNQVRTLHSLLVPPS
jgi:hypothetical protein